MTVPRLTIKDQKVGSSPIPRKLCPIPQITEIILPFITREITQLIKANYTTFQGQTHPLQWPTLLSMKCCYCWVAKSCPTLCDPHGLQHIRLSCPPSPRICSNSHPLSQWCHPTIFCHPLLLLPSIFPSIRVLSNEWAVCIRWSKYWSFSVSPSNEYSGVISFKVDRFDLLAVTEWKLALDRDLSCAKWISWAKDSLQDKLRAEGCHSAAIPATDGTGHSAQKRSSG